MSWNSISREVQDASADAPYDPYALFASLTGYEHLDRKSDEHLFMLLELRKDLSVARFAKGDWAPYKQPAADWIEQVQVPSLYRQPSRVLDDAHFCTALVRVEPGIVRLPAVLAPVVERWTMCLPALAQVLGHGPSPGSGTGAASAGVAAGAVIGIIDDGLAFAHERFRTGAAQTRIVAFWNQDDVGHAEPNPGYGRTLSSGQIDEILAASTSAGLIDEEQVYRRGCNDRVRQRAAHGTHVMDIACGEPPGMNGAQASPIVCVQLPQRVTRDTSGSSLSGFAIDGLHYILQRADEIGGERPIVVNFSYGMIAGPHDGTSMIERAMDEVIALRNAASPKAPLQVVLPAGNSRLARCHAAFELSQTSASKELTWRLLPDDWTPSFMEIWVPKDAKVSVTLTPPGADRASVTARGEAIAWAPRTDVVAAMFYCAETASAQRDRILIAVAPTFRLDGSRDVAPAGQWTVGVEAREPRGLVEAWIQRDDTPFGFPVRGRQSRFVDPNHLYRDPVTGRYVCTDNEEEARRNEQRPRPPQSYIKRANTINAIATGLNTIKAEAFRRSDGGRASYSGLGPNGETAATTGGIGQVRGAISDDSPAFSGIIAAGTRSAAVFAMTGTSVAAPQVTRWLAKNPSKSYAGVIGEMAPLVDIPAPIDRKFER